MQSGSRKPVVARRRSTGFNRTKISRNSSLSPALSRNTQLLSETRVWRTRVISTTPFTHAIRTRRISRAHSKRPFRRIKSTTCRRRCTHSCTRLPIIHLIPPIKRIVRLGFRHNCVCISQINEEFLEIYILRVHSTLWVWKESNFLHNFEASKCVKYYVWWRKRKQ